MTITNVEILIMLLQVFMHLLHVHIWKIQYRILTNIHKRSEIILELQLLNFLLKFGRSRVASNSIFKIFSACIVEIY